MSNDAELLQAYLETGSERAFTVLVQRHLPLVHSAALRQVGGDPHRAQEVGQTVFTLLAKKARELRGHPALVGWLYTTTHYAAAKMRRAEQRRIRREREDPLMNDNLEGASTAVDWAQMRPVIDELMLQLRESDRTAVLLRFFENRPYGEIGGRLGLSENAVRMRVDRALDTIRAALARRGIASTAAALGTALASQAVTAAPAELAATISAGAVSAAVGGGLTILMTSTLIKVGLAAGILAAGTAGLYLQHRQIARTEAENNQLRVQLAKAESQLATEISDAAETGAARHGRTIPQEGAILSGSGTAASSENRDPEKGLTRLQYFKNVGQATPAAAIQTIIWAAIHGDSSLPDMLFLNQAARIKADDIIASLPESAKEEYGTPEKLGALWVSSPRSKRCC